MWKFILNKVFKAREKLAVDLGGEGDMEKPFIEHLEDLRGMIVRMAVTIFGVTILTFVYCKELLVVIKYPIALAGLQKNILLINLQPTGGFMTAMNISLVAGIVLAFPLLIVFLLQFVLPGLKATEKKVLWPALAIGGGLFLTGMLFSYYVVLPRALEFFYTFSVDFIGNSDGTSSQSAEVLAALDSLKSNPESSARVAEMVIKTLADHHLIGPSSGSQGAGASGMMSSSGIYLWDLVAYVKFVCQFILLFGACFELPVLVMGLVKLDVLNYRMMRGTRSWAAVIIVIVAAVITPTQDALTLSLLAVPMYVLYEICIWLAYMMEKRDRKLNPEYYSDLEREEAAQKADEDAAAEWDNEDYNPWSSDDDGEDEDLASKRKPAESATTENPASGESSEKTEHAPDRERTIEESSREDEGRNTD